MKKVVVTLILFSLAATIYGGGKAESGDRLQVVATTSLVADVVSRIAGDRVDLQGLMAPGKDPHTYEPTPRDMALVEKADLVFSNGFDLEEGLLETLRSVRTGMVVEVSRGIDVLGFAESDEHEGEDHEGEDEHEGEEDHHDGDEEHHEGEEDHHDGEDDNHDGHDHEVDPHTWTSPLNVLVWADNIAEALAESDPENRDYYWQRADSYQAELRLLDKEIRSELSVIPRENRILISDHKALNYFARDYGFDAAGAIIPGFSTNSDTSVRRFAALVHLIEERNVKAIFIGSTSGDAIRKMGEAVRAEVGYPIPVIPLLSGSLMPAGQEGDDYLGYIRYNVRQILSGLDR